MPDIDIDTMEIHSIGIAAFLLLDGHFLRSELTDQKKVIWLVQDTPRVRASIKKYETSPIKKFQEKVILLKDEMNRMKVMAGRE